MILVSACLAGIKCKYSGEANTVASLEALYKEGKCTAVCPECLGGLDTPRPCAEIQNGHVINTLHQDVTRQYIEGSTKALETAEQAGCTEAVLKANSPSCGCGTIYDGTFTHTVIKGNGIFAQMCIDHGIACITDIEYQEGRK